VIEVDRRVVIEVAERLVDDEGVGRQRRLGRSGVVDDIGELGDDVAFDRAVADFWNIEFLGLLQLLGRRRRGDRGMGRLGAEMRRRVAGRERHQAGPESDHDDADHSSIQVRSE